MDQPTTSPISLALFTKKSYCPEIEVALPVELSLQSHAPSQRSNGMLTIAGGIVITFTHEILALITT